MGRVRVRVRVKVRVRVGVGVKVRVAVGVKVRVGVRAHQLEHCQPVADLAAVLLEELARQLEDVALRWSGFGVGAEVGAEVGVRVRDRVRVRLRVRVRVRVSAKAMLMMGRGGWERQARVVAKLPAHRGRTARRCR